MYICDKVPKIIFNAWLQKKIKPNIGIYANALEAKGSTQSGGFRNVVF